VSQYVRGTKGDEENLPPYEGDRGELVGPDGTYEECQYAECLYDHRCAEGWEHHFPILCESAIGDQGTDHIV
jgi:hypothetical protein